MVPEVDWADTIEKWFEKGEDDSEDLIGLPWEITKQDVEGGVMLIAKEPRIPFEIQTLILKDLVKLGINTNIETDFLEPMQRLKVYKVLLTINTESIMVKTGITGLESVVMVGSDLSIPSLDRSEFNMALSSLVMTTYAVYKHLGQEEKLNEFATQRILQMAYDRISSGKKAEEVVEYLIKKVGLDEESAKGIVDSIEEKQVKMKEEDKEDLTYIG